MQKKYLHACNVVYFINEHVFDIVDVNLFLFAIVSGFNIRLINELFCFIEISNKILNSCRTHEIIFFKHTAKHK